MARATPAGDAERQNIVLIGFMGAGKTVVGKALAERTGREHVDVDTLATEGSSIEEIFAAEGEQGFRRKEHTAIERAARLPNVVISAGGGAVLDPANVKALRRSGVVVYLEAGVDELASRLAGRTDRPLLRSATGELAPDELREKIRTMLTARAPLYEGAADHVVAGGGRSPSVIAAEIERRLDRRDTVRPSRVRVPLAPPYSVLVGRGLLLRAGDLVKLAAGTEKAMCVSHPRVKRLWGEALEAGLRSRGLTVDWWTFPEGEEQKTMETAARLVGALARAKMHRGDVVLALGGGVVGDLAGYAASTYARGIGFVQVPTTLLAMVDAAIGGKTGVNLPQGKNLVGTFYQPLGVVADLDVLETLPERELRGGLAEVVKYGFIAEPALARTVLRRRDEIFARGPVLKAIVTRCAGIKANVVAADERDEGIRAILNYGHTMGHAVEALSMAGRLRGSSKKLHHGEAVAIGMVYAAAVAETMGGAKLIGEHRRVLEAVGLPTRVDAGARWKEVRERMQMDKKYARGLRMVLLDRPGVPAVRRVPEPVLERAFGEVSS